MSARRIDLTGLQLGDSANAQFFEIPDGIFLDGGERLIIGDGGNDMKDAVTARLGWPTDSSVIWICQEVFCPAPSGGLLTLSLWDGVAARTLDAVPYVGDVSRSRFAGRDVLAAEADLSFGGTALGGVANAKQSVSFGFGPVYGFEGLRGAKRYELADHLGNVAVVVSDRGLGVDSNMDSEVDFFGAEVLSARDFYPFGMVMPERSFAVEGYRYGFNGKEFDSEWKGEGNSYDYGFRVHDARLGRFLSVDPLAPEYPWYSPYQFGGNTPIWAIDLDGAEPVGHPARWKSISNYPATNGVDYYELIQDVQGCLYVVYKNYPTVSNSYLTYHYMEKESWDLAVEHATGANFIEFRDEGALAKDAQKVWYESAETMKKIFVGEVAAALVLTEVVAAGGLLLIGEEIIDEAIESVVGFPIPTNPLDFLQDVVKHGWKKTIKKYAIQKPCGCFVSGTLVLTDQGMVSIEDIEVGDMVWSLNDTTGVSSFQKVVSVFEREFGEIYEIHIGGIRIRVTHEHPFWVNGKWLKVENLKIGDTLSSIKNGTHVIDTIFIRHGIFNVHNIEVARFHTYFVSPLNTLVHNGSPCFFNNLHGKSLKSIQRKAKDLGWVRQSVDTGTGWKYVDKNNIERIRYRVNKKGKYLHEENGYIRWQNGKGQNLDINGNVWIQPKDMNLPKGTRRDGYSEKYHNATHIDIKYLND